MIPWYVAVICGLVGAFLVVGVGGVATFKRSRKNKDNRFIDAFVGAVIALILMGGYVIVTANDGSFFTMLLGACIAAAGPPGIIWIQGHL